MPDKFYPYKYDKDIKMRAGEVFLSKRGIKKDQLASHIPAERLLRERNSITNDFFISSMDPDQVLSAYFRGLGYALFRPFPWRIKKFTHALASVHMAIWYALFPFMCAGLYGVFRKPSKDKFVLVAFFFIFVSALALGEGNVGALIRHREIISFAYVIFAAAGLVNTFSKKKEAG